MRNYQARAVALDSALVILTAVGLERLRLTLDDSFVPMRHPGIQIFIIVAIWSSAMWVEGAYNPRILGYGVQEFKTVTSASFKGFLLVCFGALAANQHPPRINLFVGWFCSVLMVALGRKLLRVYMKAERRAGRSMRNVLILGSNEYAVALTSRLATETQLGMRAVGHIPLHTPASHLREEVWLETIDQSIRDGGVKIIIIEDSQGAQADLLSKLSWHLLRHEVEVLVAPSFIHQFGPRLEVEAHTKLPLLYLDEPALGILQTVTKRVFDIMFSILAIVALSPILIVTTFGILITDFGPIFFIQERVGLNGQTFRIFKFRSMVVNAQDLQESVWQSSSDDGTNNKAKNDPRITSIGRLIRKFSIDELPQLINVLKGDMSIVGPRPIQEVELEMLSNLDLRRHLIKPGLTGLWQISGRSDTTWEERIQLDLDYLHNWSMALDTGIILKTIRVVATGEGAY